MGTDAVRNGTDDARTDDAGMGTDDAEAGTDNAGTGMDDARMDTNDAGTGMDDAENIYRRSSLLRKIGGAVSIT